ncbi:MAG: hypothetical protein ACI9D0_001612 [Bacteroidia bacterium]|jgi:hypothetical protein
MTKPHLFGKRLLGPLFVLLVASCAATSNLDERPAWVFDGTLPIEHPAAFQASEHLVVITVGIGETLEVALGERDANAEQQMRSKIMKAASSSLSVGKGSEAYKATVEQVAEAGASEVLGLMMRKATWDGFEGDQRYAYGLFAVNRSEAADQLVLTVSDNYDRLKAIEVGLAAGPSGQDQLERLSLEAIECIARLGVVKDLVRYIGGVSSVGWVDDFAGLEQRSLDRLIEAGSVREKTGLEAELRTALNFYLKASASHPSGILSDAIARCEFRLPCTECKAFRAQADSDRQTLLELSGVVQASGPNTDNGRTGVEIAKAARNYRYVMGHECAYFTERTSDLQTHQGFALKLDGLEGTSSNIVLASGSKRITKGTQGDLEEVHSLYSDFLAYRSSPVIAGQLQNLKRQLPCTECGTGKECMTCDGTRGAHGPCSHCNGNQTVQAECYTCDGDGMRSCGSCSGSGSIVRNCNPCGRSGQVSCSGCNGYGSKADNCYGCAGTGWVWTVNGNQTCWSCNGKGQTTSTCWSCSGSGTNSCDYCGGDGQTRETCGTCDGDRRSGTCGKCNGARQISVPCRDCSDGSEFYNCSHCSGRGLCPTCGGRGHRI